MLWDASKGQPLNAGFLLFCILPAPTLHRQMQWYDGIYSALFGYNCESSMSASDLLQVYIKKTPDIQNEIRNVAWSNIVTQSGSPDDHPQLDSMITKYLWASLALTDQQLCDGMQRTVEQDFDIISQAT